VSRWVTLVADRAVFLMEEDSHVVKAWSFENGAEMRWVRAIPGTANRGQAYLGYHEKNVIIPGRASIYFLNEVNGCVNYRFSLPGPGGEAVVPEREWFLETGVPGRDEIVSYAVFNGYLFGCTRESKQPIYVWKIPDPLVPVRQ
jgi:hypothetical protein